MDISDFRSELEEDLAWRVDELRHLRNELLGDIDRDQWPAVAMRSILVMQYAHLEGFAQNCFAMYVSIVNQQRLRAHEVNPHLFASALVNEFETIRLGSGGDQESEGGRLLRRARSQVRFVEKLRRLSDDICLIDVDAAVSMEMNFGPDVLRRTLFRLGIPETELNQAYYDALEFVRRTRNDIAHGSRKERIAVAEFDAYQRKCEQFMGELVRMISIAAAAEIFRASGTAAA